MPGVAPANASRLMSRLVSSWAFVTNLEPSVSST
jgi:hypothetical protein